MGGKNLVEKIDDLVQVRHVLASVSNKKKLDEFIPRLLYFSPAVTIFSTGGTYTRLIEILGEAAAGTTVIQVSDYTGQPETQGGLVKTLDFKIYLGLLTETYNDAHQADLQRTQAVPIDMVIVNLYPFKETIAKSGVTVEMARGNIDIGGPCMIRAAAKNFIRVASVVDPEDYGLVLRQLEENKGSIPLETRSTLAQKAFQHTAVYDQTIADFLSSKRFKDVKGCYN